MMKNNYAARTTRNNDKQLKVPDDNNCQEGFMIEMIMRCRIYQILVQSILDDYNRNGLSLTLKNKYAVEKISNGKRTVHS